jgi:hypothetical protein
MLVKTVSRVFLPIAAIFLIGAVLLLVLGLAGRTFDRALILWGIGTFVSAIPAILIMNKLADPFPHREVRKKLWQIALRGAPEWVLKAVKITGGLAMLSFLSLLLVPRVHQDEIGKRIMLPLYEIFFSGSAAAIFYSALHARDQELRCVNGHQVSLGEKFCSQCGTPVFPL